jgi:hypothetical protein
MMFSLRTLPSLGFAPDSHDGGQMACQLHWRLRPQTDQVAWVERASVPR